MNQFPVRQFALAAAILVGGFSLAGVVQYAPAFFQPSTPAPEPTPLLPNGPDMLAAFGSNPDKKQAAADASQFAEVCWHAADCVLDDGTRGEGSILLVSGLDLARFRSNVCWYSTRGARFAPRYPNLPVVVAAWLDKEAGTSAEKLTDAQRAAWSTALAALGQNSQYAAENLK